MIETRLATREPQAPVTTGKLRRGILAAMVAASFAAGVVLAPIAGAAPTAGVRSSAPVSSHIRAYGQCPGVQIGC